MLLALTLVLVSILWQGRVNAEDTFTTDDGIVVTKKSSSSYSGGNVERAITNNPLKEEVGYE